MLTDNEMVHFWSFFHCFIHYTLALFFGLSTDFEAVHTWSFLHCLIHCTLTLCLACWQTVKRFKPVALFIGSFIANWHFVWPVYKLWNGLDLKLCSLVHSFYIDIMFGMLTDCEAVYTWSSLHLKEWMPRTDGVRKWGHYQS